MLNLWILLLLYASADEMLQLNLQILAHICRSSNRSIIGRWRRLYGTDKPACLSPPDEGTSLTWVIPWLSNLSKPYINKGCRIWATRLVVIPIGWRTPLDCWTPFWLQVSVLSPYGRSCDWKNDLLPILQNVTVTNTRHHHQHRPHLWN